MKTRGTGIVGYNVQTAVDAKHHLMVAHDVTNVGIDRDQLSSMAKQARDAMGTEGLTVIADRGYFKSEEILACQEAGITAIVPKTMTSGAKADGRFDRADFIYDAQKNVYRCPAAQSLIWRYSTVEREMTVHRYWRSPCGQCAIKEKCTPSVERRLTRWAHEDVLESMQTRLDQAPNSMRPFCSPNWMRKLSSTIFPEKLANIAGRIRKGYIRPRTPGSMQKPVKFTAASFTVRFYTVWARSGRSP